MLWCCENFVPLGQLIAISMPRQAHEHSRVSVVNTMMIMAMLLPVVKIINMNFDML